MTMKYDPEIHHRRTIRLRGYDYSSEGAYFVTICTQERERLLGEIDEDRLILSDVGRVVDFWWRELPQHFEKIRLDVFTVMPNHIHGIIWLVGADRCVRPKGSRRYRADTSVCPYRAKPLSVVSLAKVVQWFKTMSANEYIRGMRENKWPIVTGRLWQRNYYEHIVRDEKELYRIRQYVIENPANWAKDEDNPINW